MIKDPPVHERRRARDGLLKTGSVSVLPIRVSVLAIRKDQEDENE